jgi:DNA-binding transcriptional LysR family regulator
MKITLRQIRVFDAIARHGKVGRAAEEISISQSAASMSLADLESHLGTPLFHRQGKRLQLNDYGRWLQPRAHQLLTLALEIETSAASDQLQGRLKLGASSTIGNYLIPAVIANFVDQHPDVAIDLRVGNTEQVIEDMRNLRVDIGLIEGICHNQQLQIHAWRRDQLEVFVSPNHPLAKKKRLKLQDLADAYWILREPGSGTREIFTLATRQHLPELKVKLELGNSEAIKQAVKGGLGLGCLSNLAIASEISHGELVALPIADLNLERQLYIIERENQLDSKLVSTFRQALIAEGS